MKKFFIVILFLIGFILIGIEGGNLFSQMGINIPFLDYKEEKQLPKFIGVICCLVSIFLFRSSRKRKLNEVQQKINVEKEKYNKWYDNLSEEEKIEIQYKNWVNENPGDEGLFKKLDLLMKDTFNLTPLELRIVHGSKEEQEKRDQDYKEELKRDNLKKEERKNELLQKFDLESVDKIMSKKLWLGMTEEMLFEVRSRPLDISESVSKGVVKKKNYYDKSTNRLGNDAFDFEVTLEDGKVTGWKDRRNRGTRDI